MGIPDRWPDNNSRKIAASAGTLLGLKRATKSTSSPATIMELSTAKDTFKEKAMGHRMLGCCAS